MSRTMVKRERRINGAALFLKITWVEVTMFKQPSDQSQIPRLNFRWNDIKHLPNHWDEQFEDTAVPPIASPNMVIDPELPGPEPLPRP